MWARVCCIVPGGVMSVTVLVGKTNLIYTLATAFYRLHFSDGVGAPRREIKSCLQILAF